MHGKSPEQLGRLIWSEGCVKILSSKVKQPWKGPKLGNDSWLFQSRKSRDHVATCAAPTMPFLPIHTISVPIAANWSARTTSVPTAAITTDARSLRSLPKKPVLPRCLFLGLIYLTDGRSFLVARRFLPLPQQGTADHLWCCPEEGGVAHGHLQLGRRLRLPGGHRHRGIRV